LIKFFRKTDQYLLIKNKTGKYFKYAIDVINKLMIIKVSFLLNLNFQQNQPL